MPDVDAVVVGAGPNGLAAAIELQRSGCNVLLLEAKSVIGGGSRTEEVTLPGFRHDICAAIHPLGLGSPFFQSLPLQQFGLQWIQPDIALAHPLDDGSAGLMYQSLSTTAYVLGEDGESYRKLMEPYARHWQKLAADILGPLPLPPKHPILMARFGLSALQPARWLAERRFRTTQGRALFAGMAAHSFIPLENVATASFGMVLGILGHAVGWPIPRGGSQHIVNAMAAYFISLGGVIETERRVTSVDELPDSRVVLFDLTARQVEQVAGDHLPEGYRKDLRSYRYGPGIFKIDWALDGPIPWTNPDCHRAGTVHVGGTLPEIAAGERAAFEGRVPERPFVLMAQQSTFDDTRAPDGQHTGWAYCHVPNGSTVDMTERIENQIERFAPGFKKRIIKRATINTEQYQAYNANYVGGDINGGVQDLGQLFTRPTLRAVPYSTPNPRLFICSSSTPPGGGVHGMCGYHAARAALRTIR